MNTAIGTEEDDRITGFRLAPIQSDLWRRRTAGREPRAWAAMPAPHGTDLAALAAALETASARHDTLRTVFRQRPWMGAPLQSVESALPARAEVVDGRGQPLATLWRRLRERPLPPADGSGGALWEALLVRTDAGDRLWLGASALIADARSLRLLLREIAATIRGEPPEPPDEVQFLHYSEWANDRAEDQAEDPDGDALRAFWDRIADAPVEAPTIPGVDMDAADGGDALVEAEVEAEAVAPAQDAATTLAAWAAVLGRLAQQRRLRFGVLRSKRDFEELQHAIGPFSDLVPVDVDWGEEDTAGATADALAAMIAERGDSLPLAGRARRCFDRPGLGFRYREPAPEEIADAAIADGGIDADDDLADWALLLDCRRDGDRLDLRLRGRCDRERALHLVEALAATLEAFAPQARMDALPRIGASETERVVRVWNEACRHDRDEDCIHRAFEAAARRSPDAQAVVSADTAYTFAGLDARANRLAHLLRARGVAPGDRVAIAMPRCADLVVALLAVLKCGGVYVPLDPDSPRRRLAMLIARARAAAVLCDDPARLVGIDTDAIVATIEEDALAAMPDAPPEVEVSPAAPAYMIFTSGSTGEPKAAVIAHRSAVNLARALQAGIYDTRPGALRLTVNAPVSFDASVKQIVQLLNGHCLHVIPEAERRDGAALLALLRAQRIDGLDCTPSHLKLLLAAGFDTHPGDWPSLVLIGGEPIDPDTWKLLAAHPVDAWNMYGPTETTVNASFAAIAPGSTPNIGRPVQNVRLYILDEALRPLPIGVAGELCIGGAGVGLGYFDNPGLSAERFVDDPFVPGGRMYRSGDLARWRADGSVEFCGRIDQQMKIRGYRIEPGEIVAAMREHPGVGDAAVIEDEGALVAYVAPDGGEADGDALDPESFKAGLAAINHNETAYLYEEIFVKHSYVRHGIRLPDDACVFDVGANIGMFSMYVARHARRPRIFAFEPLAPIGERLRANLARRVPDATVLDYGLSSAPADVDFTYYPGYSMMSGVAAYADPQSEVEVIKTFLRNEQADNADSAVLLANADALLSDRFREERHRCALRRLSDAIREHAIERIDLLKIDVQRCELDVLEGIDEDDWVRVQQVVMEVHDGAGTATEGRTGDLLDLLERRGFTVEIEQDPLLRGTDRYNLYAWRPAFVAEAEARGARPPRQALPEPAALEAFLSERLPDYMVPTHYVAIPKLPLTANGKLDRAALPRPGLRRRDRDAGAAEPDCWQERELAEVWARVLRLERVGVEDDFFQIGGDSIRSIQAQAQAKKRGLHFELQALFRHHSIRQLVRNTDLAQATPASAAAEPFALLAPCDRAALPEDAVDAFPLGALQAGMVYHTELSGRPQTYHNATSYRLGAPLDEALLRRAIGELMQAHPLLRASFHFAGYGEPLQIVHREAGVPLRVRDLSAASPEAQMRIVDEDVAAELATAFDFERAPLVRFHAHRLDETSFMLTIAEYHAILDGWSLHLVLHEIRQRYAAAIGAGAPPPALPRLGYARFVELEREVRGSPEALAFWRERLRGAPYARLPRDRAPAAPGAPRRIEALHAQLPDALAEGVRAFARESGVPLKSALFALHVRMMAAACGVDDVVTGLVVNGRPEEDEGDRVIGLFINTLPLRVALRGDSWRALARRAFEAESAAVAWRRMPPADLQRLRPAAPLFDAFFNFSSFHTVPGGEAEGVPLTETRTHPTDVAVPLAVDIEIDPATDAMTLLFQYDAALFDPAPMRALHAAYLRALQAMVETPDAPCDALAVLEPRPTAVAAPARTTQETSADEDPPRTPLEGEIAAAWQTVLGLDRVGRRQRFGDLGGHSLLATRLLAQLRRSTGRPLSLALLGEDQTVAGLAQALENETPEVCA